MPEILIIAEAGVNHNGSRERAVAMVAAAARSGADIIKFQTFKADRLATGTATKAAYQQVTTGAGQSQLDMLRGLELSEDDHHAVAEACRQHGILLLSTPFDENSATFLKQELGLDRIKIGSGDLTNAPLLLHVSRLGTPVILSTGMATLAEIETALSVLAFGYTSPPHAQPTSATLAESLVKAEGWEVLRHKVTLLHCTTEYPAPPGSVNLRAMETLRQAFGLPVGFSDHTRGIHIAAAAAALGAIVIEKHFTLDRGLPGPDHRASLEPDELAALVEAVREVEAALGDGRKRPAAAEYGNRAVARRCLVAAQPIRAGEALTEANLAVKRAGEGIAPVLLWSYLGRHAARDYRPDEVIDQ